MLKREKKPKQKKNNPFKLNNLTQVLLDAGLTHASEQCPDSVENENLIDHELDDLGHIKINERSLSRLDKSIHSFWHDGSLACKMKSLLYSWQAYDGLNSSQTQQANANSKSIISDVLV
jgi:hypothetical protein